MRLLEFGLSDLDKAYREGRKFQDAIDGKTCSLFPEGWDGYEGLCRFCFDVAVTFDEASGSIKRIPHHDYLEWILWNWLDTSVKGQVLAIEKSRRLVVSWLLCAADVWDGLSRRCNVVQGGATYAKAQEFVWRCWFVHEQARLAHPELGLRLSQHWGNPLAQKLDGLAFEGNGTLIEPLNSDGESFRGSGYTRVKLEELSSYRYVGNVLSQAAAVTSGPPGMPGGHVVLVCNARNNKEWKQFKRKP